MKTISCRQLKKKTYTCLFIFILLFCPIYSQNMVIGYYPEYSSEVVSPENIKYENLTNIIHAFAWPDTNGNIFLYDGMQESNLIEEAHKADVKVSLAFGGAGVEPTKGFAMISVVPEKRAQFITGVIHLITTNGYDGVDLDWEFPSNDEEREAYTLLVKELRAALDEVDSSLTLSMAINPLDYYGQWTEYEKLVDYLDWISMMGYDFHGEWFDHTGHNAPLYESADDEDGAIDESFVYLNEQRKIPAEKLVLGLAFYGKVYKADGLNEQWEAFDDSVDVILSDYRAVLSEVSGDSNYTYNWDEEALVPYYINTVKNRFITFDDTTSLRLKCEYALAKGMKGVMIWEITQDLIDEDTQPLLEQVGVSMGLLTSVKEVEGELASSYELYDNYPNPFNPTTNIKFSISEGNFVSLKVYDVLGREVDVLVNKYLQAGTYEAVFDASRLSSGIYFYALRSGDFSETKKMLLVK